METIFYILIYLSAVCPSFTVYTITDTNTFYQPYQENCAKSELRVETKDSIDDLVAYQNDTIGKSMYLMREMPDKIIQVKIKDGKRIEKEIKIVPVTQKIKKTIEHIEEKIIKYQIE